MNDSNHSQLNLKILWVFHLPKNWQPLNFSLPQAQVSRCSVHILTDLKYFFFFFNNYCFFLLQIFLKHHSLLEFFRSHWPLHLHLLFWLYLNVGVSRLSSWITYPLFDFMHWWFCLLIEPYNFKHHGYVNYIGFTLELQTHTYNYILNISIWVLMSISCLIPAKLNAYFPPCLLLDTSLFQ